MTTTNEAITSSIVLSWAEDKKLRVAWVFAIGKNTTVKLYQTTAVFLHPAKWEVKGDGYLLNNAYPVVNTTKKAIEIIEALPTDTNIKSSVAALAKMETL